MRIKLLFIILLGCIEIGEAQKLNFSYESNLSFGSIFRHTSKFEAPINGKSIGGEFNILFNTTGSKVWHEFMGYPTFGLAASYFNFGDKEIFGNGYGINANVYFRFLQKKWMYGHFRMGSGLAILDTPFDIIGNPVNDVTSAYLNNITNFRFGFGWIINKHWEVLTSATLTHYSNAASVLPNLGINVAAFNLGLHYSPNPLREEDYKHYDQFPAIDKRIRYNVHYAMAFRESGTSGGPKFPIYLVSFSANRMLTRSNRLHAGIEYEYASNIYAFISHIELYESEKRLRNNASRVIFYIGDEVIWGRTAIYMQIGTYLTNSYGQQFPVFEKLGIRYYFPVGKQELWKIHIGIYLKAHKTTAESVSYGLGFLF